MAEETVVCETPTPGKAPVRIPKWKYALVQAAIVSALLDNETLELSALFDAVTDRLTPDRRRKLGSVRWHVMAVKLDLERRGELRRIGGERRQRLALNSARRLDLTFTRPSRLSRRALHARILSEEAAAEWTRPLGLPLDVRIEPGFGGSLRMRHRRGDDLIEHEGVIVADEAARRVVMLWDLAGARAPDLLDFTVRSEGAHAALDLTCRLNPRWSDYVAMTRDLWSEMTRLIAADR